MEKCGGHTPRVIIYDKNNIVGIWWEAIWERWKVMLSLLESNVCSHVNSVKFFFLFTLNILISSRARYLSTDHHLLALCNITIHIYIPQFILY